MAYTALYRKYRPLTFHEIVGQDHITKTIRNQIMQDRVGHAYLFSGGRGTGKTSAAKVLSRAINCLNPKDGEPCNECEVCKGILNGSLTDVVEMDAASNNSVEDVRSIREEVNFLPTIAKYRVYIIDEVHMLSTGAFNALLKTLEEPPEHVKFILATTEPQKLPATILSRCQRFDFKRIGEEFIISRLKTICKDSKISITEEALKLIAVLSEGGMRDSISILERCLQDGENEISEDKVKDLVGIPKLTFVHQITKAILNYDAIEAMNAIENVLNEGKDLNNFLWEIIKYHKDLLMLKTGAKLPLYSTEEIKQMKELEEVASKERLLKLIYALSELENSIKWSSQKQIMFQTGIIRACMKEEHQGIEELQKQVNELQKRMDQGNFTSPRANTTTSKIQQATKMIKPEGTEKSKSTENKVIPKETKTGEYLSFWPDIINKLKQTGKIMIYTNLLNTKARKANDLIVEIEFPGGMTAFGKTVLEKHENKEEISKLISMECGKQMQIKYVQPSKEEKASSDPIENIAKDLDIPINIIDE